MAVKRGKVKAGQGSTANKLIKEPVAEALSKAQFECKCRVICPAISHVPSTRFFLSSMETGTRAGCMWKPCNSGKVGIIQCYN